MRPHFGGVVEVYHSNFGWRERDRGRVKVRYSIYFVGSLPHFVGVVEVEVYHGNFSWRSCGRRGVEVRYSIYFVGPY